MNPWRSAKRTESSCVAGGGLVAVQRAEALLVPLAVRRPGDQAERDQHQHVPLPPRRSLSSARRPPRSSLRRGGRRRPRRRAAAPRRAFPPELYVADDGEGVERPSRPPRGRQGEPSRTGTGSFTSSRSGKTARDRISQAANPISSPISSSRGRMRLAVERRQRGEPAGEHEPDRRRDHEAQVGLVEQHLGHRECMEREEARGGEEPERDEVDAPIAATTGGGAGRVVRGRRSGRPSPRTSQKWDGWCCQCTSVPEAASRIARPTSGTASSAATERYNVAPRTSSR